MWEHYFTSCNNNDQIVAKINEPKEIVINTLPQYYCLGLWTRISMVWLGILTAVLLSKDTGF